MFGWGFLGAFFFFAGIGAILGIIYGLIKGFPLVLDGFIFFFKNVFQLLVTIKDLAKEAVSGFKDGLDGKYQRSAK